MPEHKNFEKRYVQWRLETPKPELKPYILNPEEMDIVNKIYAMPVAKSILFELRWTEREKLRMAIDEEKMQQNFVEDLRAQIFERQLQNKKAREYLMFSRNYMWKAGIIQRTEMCRKVKNYKK